MLKAELSRQFGTEQSVWPLLNKERYQALTRWAAYLGFGYNSSLDGFYVDPTAAIKRTLAHISQAKQPLESFLAELGDLLPCCGVGRVSSTMRSSLNHVPGNGALMPGLSLGLLRLNEQRLITLSDESDAATTYEFLLAPGATVQRFSHVDTMRAR